MTKWRSVPGYEGYYEVSDQGDVRRIARSKGATVGRILAHRVGTDGYPYVHLAKDAVHRNRAVHILVLEAFAGPRPPGMEACHNDGDKRNAALSNLRWGTPSENNFDIVRHGRNVNANKTHCPRGHEYSEENTYRWPSDNGKRRCRTCKSERRMKATA